MEETVMEGPSDAGSIPASSISCGKEGPTQWEDALSHTPGKEGPTQWEDALSHTPGKEGSTQWEDALSHTTDSWLKFENVYVRMDRKMRY